MKKVAIIGAGACGMVLAGLLKDRYDVSLYEKNNKLAKKILASGNGKCNFTNISDFTNKYNHEFANKIIDRFNNEDIRDYFYNLGLTYKVDEENRVYPLSESSLSVVDILKDNLKGVKIYLDSKVKNLEVSKDKCVVITNNSKISYDYLVLCSGSKASNLGSDDSYNYLSKLDLNFKMFKPSLTSIRVSNNLSIIQGVRVKANVSLYKNDKLVHKEKGEVLFKENALGGIVILNLSSYINRDIDSKYKISLDLCVDGYDNKYSSNLKGLVHPKILEYLLKYNISDIKNIEFDVLGVNEDFNVCQVCSGGIELSEINKDLSLKKYPNVFVGGELIDIDGVCGGYNLSFAFSCAMVINESLKIKKI